MSSRKTITLIAALAIAFATSCISAFATGPSTTADVLKVDVFDNNTVGFPDGTVYIVNGGESASNLCADIYVFNNAEELEECCACPSSYSTSTTLGNGVRALSIQHDLTGNPVNGVSFTTGAIFIVSAAGNSSNTCSTSTNGFPTVITPEVGLRAMGTKVDADQTISKGEFQDVPLSTGSRSEQATLQTLCNSIKLVGSFKGQCTCGSGM